MVCQPCVLPEYYRLSVPGVLSDEEFCVRKYDLTVL
jgi:hypothetical protein